MVKKKRTPRDRKSRRGKQWHEDENEFAFLSPSTKIRKVAGSPPAKHRPECDGDEALAVGLQRKLDEEDEDGNRRTRSSSKRSRSPPAVVTETKSKSKSKARVLRRTGSSSISIATAQDSPLPARPVKVRRQRKATTALWQQHLQVQRQRDMLIDDQPVLSPVLNRPERKDIPLLQRILGTGLV